MAIEGNIVDLARYLGIFLKCSRRFGRFLGAKYGRDVVPFD